MKLILLLSSLILTVNSGLLDSLQENKEESKSPDLLKKISTDLKDDGKIFVDILTASFKKKTEDKKKDPTKNEKVPAENKLEDTKVTESTPKSPDDTKPKPEDAEETVTTPKSPEVAPAGEPEASTTKTEEISSAKAEGAASKTETKEAAPKTE